MQPQTAKPPSQCAIKFSLIPGKCLSGIDAPVFSEQLLTRHHFNATLFDQSIEPREFFAQGGPCIIHRQKFVAADVADADFVIFQSRLEIWYEDVAKIFPRFVKDAEM